WQQRRRQRFWKRAQQWKFLCLSSPGISSKSIHRQKNAFSESNHMDLKQIKELMNAMKRGGIKKLTIKEKTGYELHLECEDQHPPYPSGHAAFAYPQVFSSPPHVKEIETARHTAPAITQHKPHVDVSSTEESGRYVTAPLVGTFYNAPSPEDPP